MDRLERNLRSRLAALVSLLPMTVAVAGADTWLPVAQESTPTAPETVVHAYGAKGIDLTVFTDGVALRPRLTPQGSFVDVTWPQACFTGEVGTPALPVVRRMFAAPEGATIDLSVWEGPASTIDLAAAGFVDPVTPAQAPIPMLPGALEAAPQHFDDAAYASDRFAPERRAVIRDWGVMRGWRLYVLEVRPVAYSPLRHALAVWPEIQVGLRFDAPRRGGVCGDIRHIRNLLLNPPPEAPDGEPGRYFIAVTEGLASGITPFVTAKTAMGFEVYVYSVPEGTTKETIKFQIEDWYNPVLPGYVLIIGDSDTMPVWTGQGAGSATTDLYYGCMDPGDDWVPDLGVGRFPVRTIAQLQAMMDKVMFVEAGNFSDPEYIKHAAFLAGTDGSSGDHASHDFVIDNILEPRDYICHRIYERNGYTTQDVLDTLNAGCMYGVYFGHSNSGHLYNGPSITQSNVQSLSNQGLYHIFLAFSCNNCRFTSTECIGETFVRQAEAGAVAIIGTTYYIYYIPGPWDETQVTERSFFQAVHEDEVTNISPAWQAGIAKLISVYGPSDPVSRDYSEMFVLLGDPGMDIPMEVSPGIDFIVTPEAQTVCAPADAVYDLQVLSVLGYAEPVTLSASGEPAGTTVGFSVNPVTPPGTSIMTVSDTAAGQPGEYLITITGTGPDVQRSTIVTLGLSATVPDQPVLTNPPDGAIDIVLQPLLTWQPAAQALEYELQVATDASFTNVVHSATVNETSHFLTDPLAPSTVHYWRVRGVNGCGVGLYSDASQFTTVNMIMPETYDLLNGETGTHTYFDDSYNGSGNPQQPLSPLTGGLGDLTDGVIATENWNSTPEPYVGWKTIDPTITCHFPDGVTVEAITLHFDDSNGQGGVYPPQDVTFSMSGASVQFTVEDPASGEPFAATFPDLNLFGDTLAITLADYNSSDYMMISEIEIFGDPNFAPCPADVNNDGMVDVLDLLAVLAAWGAAGGPEDINGDGIVDVLDLLALLGAWGPCAGGPPSGACCFYPSGDCYEMLEAYCIAAGGDWQGGGTDCATTVCPSAATGETIGDALPIPALPYSTDGDTSTFADDYDEVCPYANSTSSDVVYAYTPLGNQTVDITLCSDSGYDTKLYVYEDNYTPGSPFACNDDSCTTPGGQQFVSELLGLSFISGNTYFIVVDGYAGQNGYYTLDVN